MIPLQILIPMVVFVILISAQGFSSSYFYSFRFIDHVISDPDSSVLKINDCYSKSHSNKPNFDYVSNSATWFRFWNQLKTLTFRLTSPKPQSIIIHDSLTLQSFYVVVSKGCRKVIETRTKNYRLYFKVLAPSALHCQHSSHSNIIIEMHSAPILLWEFYIICVNKGSHSSLKSSMLGWI